MTRTKQVLIKLYFYILFVFIILSNHAAGDELTWDNPITVADLYGIWGTSSNSIYAVGSSGVIIYYDGSSWTAQPSQTTNRLYDIWGTGETNIYAVGDNGAILYYDGAAWSQIQSGSTSDLKSIWGSSSSDIYAVGAGGTILQFDGASWSAMQSNMTASLHGVWGVSATDVFAVGDKGTILHYDGSSWAQMESGSGANLKSVCGSASDKVFAVGDAGTILSFNGAQWSVERSGTYVYNEILGVYAINQTTGGIQTDFIAVGDSGRVAYYNGASWSEYNSATYTDLYSLWGTDALMLFVSGGTGNVFKKDTSGWSSVTLVNQKSLYGVWGVEAQYYGRQVYAMGQDGTVLYRKDCGSADAFCKDPTSGWQTDYFHIPNQATANAVWGYPIYKRTSQIYLVGDQGLFYYFQPSSNYWLAVESGVTENLNAVWGVSYSETEKIFKSYAVGNAGIIIVYDGTDCTVMSSGTTKNLWGIWGSADDDIFAVGTSGTIIHYNGSAWSAMDSGTTKSLMAVWGTASNNVYAAGFNGTILHYNGSAWSPMDSGVAGTLNAVSGISANSIFAAGDGVILKYDAGAWIKVDNIPSSIFWQAVWGGQSGVFYFTGIKGEILSITTQTSSATTTTTVSGTDTTTSTIPSGGTTTTTISGTAPGMPVNPYPEDNATNVHVTATLQWEIEGTAAQGITCDIYFGTEENPPPAAQNIDTLYYTPAAMNPDTIYYWKIVVKNENGIETAGPVWRFTTESGSTCLLSSVMQDMTTLDMLRHYRDSVLNKTAAGRKMIELYYACSRFMLESE